MTIKMLRCVRLLSIWLFVLPTLSFGATEVILYLEDVNWDVDANPKIHLMRPQGTDHRIVSTDFPVASASLNPDGDWITYVSRARKELRQVHVSGNREKVLVRLPHSSGPKGPTDVKVSPNGRYVAYTRYYSGNRIGIEVYDIRQRRFSLRRIYGREISGPRNRRINVRRLLWSPDSKTLVTSMEHTRNFFDAVREEWIADRYTFVYARNTERLVRSLRYGAPTDREPLDFISNTQLLAFGFHGQGVYTTNALYRYDIVRNEMVKLFNTTSLSTIKGLAVNPSRRLVSMDINHLTNVRGGIGFQPWAAVSGTARVPAAPWHRTFATLNLNTLTAQFTSPQTGYSDGMAQFQIDNMQNRYSPSFEWRSVRSDAAFKGTTCWGWRVTVFGTSGNDRIVGTPGTDVIAAGAGNDTIDALAGNDIICAGDGDDAVNAGPGSDTVYGDIAANQNQGSEIIYSGNDRLFGSSGDDLIDGSAGDDFVRGDAGNDRLSGGTGNDRLSGGADDDYLRGGAGNDILLGGRGEDTNNGGDGTDQCSGAIQTSECE